MLVLAGEPLVLPPINGGPDLTPTAASHIVHVKFVVRTEREGTLLTLNNNCNKNLQKARMERPMANVRRLNSGNTIGQLIGVTAIWRIWPLGHILGLVQPFVSRN